MATTRGRLVQINQTILDQADFFQLDGYTRVVGLTVADLTSQVFYNNILMPWPLTNGTPVSNQQVTAGFLYVNEITGAPGNYSVRFRPNAAGYWRINLTYPAGTQILIQDFDVTAEPLQLTGGGMKASFTKC